MSRRLARPTLRVITAAVVALSVAAVTRAEEDGFWVSSFEEGQPRAWRPEDESALVPDQKKMLMYEVTEYRDVEPTDEQQAASNDLVARARAAVERNGWYDFARAVEDGFELIFADHQHYVNKEYLLDDHVLDPDRPEFLMYYETPHGPKFAGFMFMVAKPDERGPQIGGRDTVWHYHLWPQPVCLYEGMYPIGLAEDGACAEGTVGIKSPEMMHVWTIDHPDGPFSTGMKLAPEVRAQLLEPPSQTEADHCPAPSDTRRATSEGVGPAGDYVPAPGTRFRNDWNGSVYDRQTGLQWEVKEAGSGCPHCVDDGYTWSAGSGNPDGTAFTEFLDRLNNTCNGDGEKRCIQDSECEGLGRGFCGFAGVHDWRLPTEKELRGLAVVEEGCTPPCIDSSMPGQTQTNAYWSSSASPRSSQQARAVFFNGKSGVTQGPKAAQAYVRAVRGGS